jgi:hypothetical protein
MGPGHHVGQAQFALLPRHLQRDGARAVLADAEIGVHDLPERQVQRHGQRRADAHRNAAVGQRVDGRFRLHHADDQQERANDRAKHEEERRRRCAFHPCLRRRTADGAPREEKGEIPRHPPEAQRLLGQRPPVRLTLPEDVFPLRQVFGQSTDGLGLKVVVVMRHRF